MSVEGLEIVRSGAIVTIAIDRAPVNAITLAIYEAIAETFEVLGKDDGANCAIFTGRGDRAFCAGLDLNEFLAARVEDDAHRAKIVRRTFEAVRNCAIPVIAAVNGPALGAGCVLTSVCDVRIASEKAKFGLPEINVGRCGGTAHLGRLIPQGSLRKMFFTGAPISAEEAFRIGLADEVVAPERLMPRAEELAAVIAAKAPLGLRLGKEALNGAEFLPVAEGYALEQSFSTKLMATEDAREATRAVLEKRAPRFVGR